MRRIRMHVPQFGTTQFSLPKARNGHWSRANMIRAYEMGYEAGVRTFKDQLENYENLAELAQEQHGE